MRLRLLHLHRLAHRGYVTKYGTNSRHVEELKSAESPKRTTLAQGHTSSTSDDARVTAGEPLLAKILAGVTDERKKRRRPTVAALRPFKRASRR